MRGCSFIRSNEVGLRRKPMEMKQDAELLKRETASGRRDEGEDFAVDALCVLGMSEQAFLHVTIVEHMAEISISTH